MNRILVSLVSEQTVPNVLVAEHFRPINFYWLITTSRMENEGKTRCLENALKLKGHSITEISMRKEIVNQDSLSECIEKLEKEFLKSFGFKLKNRVIEKKLNKDESIYLTGGWFEECVFNEVYKIMRKNLVDDVKMGIQIASIYSADNELDIAFMKNNTFYHIECKTLGEETEQSFIRDEVYKKGAISPLLGKGGKAFICTTHSQIKDSLSNRARDYNIVIFSLEQVRNLSKELSERIK